LTVIFVGAIFSPESHKYARTFAAQDASN